MKKVKFEIKTDNELIETFGKSSETLNKYVETAGRKRAKAIDDAFKAVVPVWQQKILLKTRSRWLGKIFGWEIRNTVNTDRFEIWNRGKKYYG